MPTSSSSTAKLRVGRWPCAVVVVGAVACTAPSASLTPTARLGTPNVLGLEVTAAYAGAPFTFTVTAAPQQPVMLIASSVGRGRGPCPVELPGTCAGIKRPAYVGWTRAGADGVGRLRVNLPKALQGTWWLQASTLDPSIPGTSEAVEVFVVDYGDDLDGDGMVDAEEVRSGLDPTRRDTDGDGLSDGAERYDHGTHPANPDTDGDGAWDGVELLRGLDPFNPDTDGDGLGDGDDLAPTSASLPYDQVIEDRLASDPTSSLPDAEFEATTQRATWQDMDGSGVYVADIDPNTGALVPLDGRGTLIDVDVGPVAIGKNGPEWMVDAQGAQVVYIVKADGDWRLWRARQDAVGWTAEAMPGDLTAGRTPYGSRDPNDPQGRVSFLRLTDAQPVVSGWRAVDDGTTTTILAPELGTIDSRWVDEPARTLVGSSDAFGDGWTQVWLLDIDTDALTQVTADPTFKYDPFVTRSPALGGRRVMSVARGPEVDAYDEIAVLHETPVGWEEVFVLPTPARHPYVISPEIFTWQGRAYVSWLASSSGRNVDNGESSVWLASLDPAEGVFRRLDDGSAMVRKDPEPYVGGTRPWVYYTEVQPNGRRIVHVCELGL